MFGGTVSIPFLLCPALCIEPDDPANGYIISTIFFVSGIVTLIQSTLGVRLPIIQGGTFTFIPPALAILSLPENQCPVTNIFENYISFPGKGKTFCSFFSGRLCDQRMGSQLHARDEDSRVAEKNFGATGSNLYRLYLSSHLRLLR